MRALSIGILVVACMAAAGCSDGDSEGGEESTTSSPPGEPAQLSQAALKAVGEPSERYADPAMWVCQGSVDDAVCAENLDLTRVAADGSTDVVERTAAEDPPADCFYVYPTVDLTQSPGNATLADRRDMELMVRQQAAQFSSSCRVFAPLYEQATIGTYRFGTGEPMDLSAPEFEPAYAQVLDAFRHYMHNENNGRPIVLLGHSQGSHHLARLVSELFEPEPELQDHMVMAGLIGAGGLAVNTRPGDDVGGTFENTPLCSSLDQTACVIAYTTFNESSPPMPGGFTSAPAGTEAACVNPAELAGGDATSSESVFDYPTMGFSALATDISAIGLEGVTTEFVGYPGAYEAECVTEGRDTWLQVRAVEGTGQRPTVPIDNELVETIGLGLHLLDYQLFAADLQAIVDAKIQAMS